ncbi:uncharacterized protein LTR77_000157 [Saxophila tyrrhenica]|uniref:NAD(P)-binding protein n=1 Tax=Saxophila tyrrhenica TaxID=1690608 RepID=A0AAV9PMI8_9PEZI|nr:hypothetical protein LTR77_000157 [Saxophila tyrrhenica]
MAFSLWTLAVSAVAVAILSFAVPLLLAELFPWRTLWIQRTSRPSVTTKSYKGRTALVTGARGAFGSRAAKAFASREIETLVLVDVQDCTGLKDEIEGELATAGKLKPTILVWRIDFMTFAGCKELGEKARELKALDHALMTMGMLSFNRRESPEGWETSIQVNFLSTALAALFLLPVLKSSAANPNPPVLTFVTTFGIYPASATMSVPKKGPYTKHLSNNKDGMQQAHQYGRSKGLLLYFARELASRTARTNGLRQVTINSADPGTAWTGLTGPNRAQLIPRLITDFAARDPQYCANALVNGVSAGPDSHGKIVMDYHVEGSFPPFMERASGRVAQQRAWEEARVEFEEKVPEVRAVYEMLEK